MIQGYRRARTALLLHLGFRGFILVAFGLMYLLIGVGVLYPNGSNNDPALVHTSLPIWFRLFVWCGLGVVAVLSGAIRGLSQKVGFFCLFCPPFERFLSYTWAVFTDGPQWLPGAALYGMIALIVRVLAAWDEPVEVR